MILHFPIDYKLIYNMTKYNGKVGKKNIDLKNKVINLLEDKSDVVTH